MPSVRGRLPDCSRRFVRDRADPLVAWRYWDVGDADGRLHLRSPFRTVVWPIGEPLRAECFGLKLAASGRAHDAPGDACRCGVYGGTYRELRTCLRTRLVRPSEAPVLGRVSLWGVVIADGNGWRAAEAYPERLVVPTLTRNAFAVAEALVTYGVPVELVDVRETYSALNPSTRLRAVR